jgi:hypothetical protein
MTTLPTVVAAAFVMLVFTMLANLVLVQYGRGVAQTAVDEAARHSVVVGADVSSCEHAIRAVLKDLIGGPFGADLSATCSLEDEVMVAAVTGRLPALVPLLSDFDVHAQASSILPPP